MATKPQMRHNIVLTFPMKAPFFLLSATLFLANASRAASISLVEAAAVPVVSQEGKISVIDVGRQLFVDDYLVKQTTLKRTFHPAKLQADAPVLKAETKLERENGTAEGAVLFDGGVWYDPADQVFKMWYVGGFRDGICYATSKDGIHWERPSLDVSPAENRVLPYHKGWALSGFSVALDQLAPKPSERFKMVAYHRYKNRFAGDGGDENPPAKMYVSADGIHWGEPQMVKPFTGDNPSIFHDPFRNYWVFSTRNRAPSLLHPNELDAAGKPITVRARFRFDGPDFIQAGLTSTKAQLWLKPDVLDKADPTLGYEPELYKFGAVAYESIMLGAYGMFYGPPNNIAGTKGKEQPKIIDIQLGFSRDGVSYPRPSRDAFIAAARTPGVWNRGYLHSANGVCLIVNDELYFYFGTWSGLSERKVAELVMSGGSVGLAKLRRDGFASMDADASGGTLTTTPVSFRGKFPFVNVAAANGELRAEILDVAGKVIAPFTLANSLPVKGDRTRQSMAWKGVDDLGALAGKPVRFRFSLTNGQLYAFWVSQDPAGASNGFVAAGGPGFTGPVDLPGRAGSP